MKAVLFDLDGTLLNTLFDLKNSMNSALSYFNLPEKSLDEIRLFIGNGVVKLTEKCCPIGTSESIQKQVLEKFKEHYFNHYKDNTLPYDGVKQMLLELKGKYKLAVVSNKVDSLAKDLVETHFPNIFDAIQGTYYDKPRKPDPFIVNLALNTLGVKAEDSVYIGDTNVDYETGRNSNISTLLVQYGFRTKEEIIKVYPDAVIVDSFSDLISKIKAILV